MRRLLAASASGLAALLAASGSGAVTVDEVLVPGGTVLSTVFPADEVETFRVDAPAGATLRVDLRRSGKGLFLPALEATLSDGSDADLVAPRRPGRWRARLPFPETGTLGLRVGSDRGAGDYRLKTKLKVPGGHAARGPNEDHRETPVPGALSGTFASLLASPPVDETPTGAFLTGGLEFDGKGKVATALNVRALVPDSGSPFGFGLQTLPVPVHTGAYYTDGNRAAISLDLGGGSVLESDFTLAGDGSILYTGLQGGASTMGLLLQRDLTPTNAELAGTWFYSSLVQGSGGTSTAEVGVLTMNAAGSVSGLGASTAVTIDESGTPVPGAQTPVLRTGSFSVAADGTVTFTTVANLFGPQEVWTTGVVFRSDILAGGGPAESPASELHLLLRQGTGLTDADVAGDYLHFGIGVGAATALRAGILAFDGAGGFEGTETVSPIAGGEPQAGVPVTGTYSVNAQGVATLAFDGGASGTGIVGPDAAYLFAFSLGEGGLGIDLLLDLGE